MSLYMLNLTLLFQHHISLFPYFGIFLVSLSQSTHLFLLFNPRPTCLFFLYMCHVEVLPMHYSLWVKSVSNASPAVNINHCSALEQDTKHPKLSEAEQRFKAAASQNM